MLNTENRNLGSRWMQALDRLVMNVLGPADIGDADTPIIHRSPEEEAAADEQLADIEVERDDQGHSWAFRKEHRQD
ncbi:hypothetical protein ACW0JT_23735 [Arthrobacter sp. SA17]